MKRNHLAASVVVTALGLWAFAASDARSAGDPAATVKERQDFMETFWPSYLKELAGIAKGASTDISHVE
jgi:hypothetical protein